MHILIHSIEGSFIYNDVVVTEYFLMKVCSIPGVLNGTGVNLTFFLAGPLVNINSHISLDFFSFLCQLPMIKVKPVLSGHSKIDKTKVLKTNGSLMKVESIAECPWSILQYF